MKKEIIYIYTILASVLFISCSSEIKDGTTDIDSWDNVIGDQYTPSLEHPGILHTAKSIKRMQTIVKRADANDPAYQTYLEMKSNNLAKSTYSMQGPYEIISRDGDYAWTKNGFEADFAAAYLNALMYAVTKDEAHAKKGIEILVKYADKLKEIPSTNDAPLLAGLQGFQIIYATEMLSHTYDKMSKEDLDKINAMLKNIFLPVLEKFYNTPAYTNGNWGIIVTKAYMAAAILWDDIDMYKKGIKFYLYGDDNGTISHYLDGETGQCQESGRDQGHTQLGLGGLATICELAYQQGNDLYSALDNRLLKGYEYSAKYNLGYDVPFKQWKDITGKYSNWSTIGTGSRGTFRAIYAIAYNHYVTRKGLSMPYTKEVALDKQPIEKYDSDNIGYGTFQFCDGDIDE
ncbi:MAG: alginate lyase family protein [Bacteroides sp.]|nr:alginate lyase family protein [Bacteroides sp.]MCI1683536.1 alginate lyase family protein [Bacteroides sp.]